MSGDEATLRFYDREGANYAIWAAPSGEYVSLDRFIAMSPADGRLLDYGCGGGWAAKRMLDAGRRVDAFDGSAALAGEAAKLTGLNVNVMRFEQFAESGLYAGVWASFCLLHAPREAMPGNLTRIERALLPGGVFYLGLKRGAGETRDSLGRFYTYFERDEIVKLLEDTGFHNIEIHENKGGGYDGVPEQVMHILCKKPAEARE
ncbi:class I SAM-dependent methyltransferase [Pikeienuella piscinae]|uniref:Class I SAM-dependent methyltransferase n=1 Tax=Pikeienuella piscinae TaxID=2748098 RepID=A0A7L5BUQ6_9RHOB|nr:class I SAM-dependent methyltransferase [Pikeienuella piscinae]QIE54147.1 class I SAM-dependent methyltransferase [Pikeienuella piscinae]